MQKPEFIKIYLPISKVENKPAVKRFFNFSRNTYLEVEFSNIRRRKIYAYKVEKVEEFKKHFKNPASSKHGYLLTLVKDKRE